MNYFKIQRLIVFFVFFILLPSLGLSTGLKQLKSVFLHNLIDFVQWPDSAFQSPKSPFNLCYVADETFSKMLHLTVKGESINNRKIVLLPSISSKCHFLFLSKEKNKVIFFDKKELVHTLIVSDIKGSAYDGAMIEIKLVENEIKFLINLKLAKEAQLTISSRLLSLAKIVENKK